MAQAMADWNAAGALATAGHYNLACFHSQQAAEKAVKALLYAEGVDDPWGHSVADLLRDGATYHPSLGRLRKLGLDLDKFYIPTRYPNGLPGGIPAEAYGVRDAKTALTASRKLLDRADRLLKELHGVDAPKRER